MGSKIDHFEVLINNTDILINVISILLTAFTPKVETLQKRRVSSTNMRCAIVGAPLATLTPWMIHQAFASLRSLNNSLVAKINGKEKRG